MFDTITRDSTILRHKENHIITNAIITFFSDYCVGIIKNYVLPKVMLFIDSLIEKVMNIRNNDKECRRCVLLTTGLKDDFDEYMDDLSESHPVIYKSYFLVKKYILQEISKSVLDILIVRTICYLNNK